jgi:hypothetical protein
VNEKKITKEKKKLNKQQQQQQQWISPSKNESNGPSFKQIMNEELNYMNTHKKTQVFIKKIFIFIYLFILDTST